MDGLRVGVGVGEGNGEGGAGEEEEEVREYVPHCSACGDARLLVGRLECRGAIEVVIGRGFSGSVQGDVWFGDGVHTVGRCGDLYKFLRRLREELQTFEHTSRPSLCHVWG